MVFGLRVSVLVGPRAGWQLAVEFSSDLRIFFVDLAAGADVELAALRCEEKRPKVIERHSTSLQTAVNIHVYGVSIPIYQNKQTKV